MSGRRTFWASLLAAQATLPALAPPLLWYRAGNIAPTALHTNEPDPGNRFTGWPNAGRAGGSFDLAVRPGDGGALYRYPTAGPGGVTAARMEDGLARLYSTPSVSITGAAPRGVAMLAQFNFTDAQTFWFWGEAAPDPECGYYALSYNHDQGLVSNHYWRRITLLPAAVCQQHDGEYLAILVRESVVNGQLVVRYRVSLADGTVLASGVHNLVPAAEINTHATPLCLGWGAFYGRGYALSLVDWQLFDYALTDEDFAAIRAEWNRYTGLAF